MAGLKLWWGANIAMKRIWYIRQLGYRQWQATGTGNVMSFFEKTSRRKIWLAIELLAHKDYPDGIKLTIESIKEGR